MNLTPTQAALLACLRSAEAGERTRRVVYCTEYLGYLPFRLYHWFIVNGEHIDSSALPPIFSRDDLDALEAAGLLCMVSRLANAENELESRTTYELSAAQHGDAADPPAAGR
jgi:hypothetical protein